MAYPTDEVVIVTVRAVAMRAPIETHVRTSFGIMRDRPAVFVEVEDDRGHRGLGEIWCNFPSVGAEHRAHLVLETAGPLLRDLSPLPVGDVFAVLMTKLHVLAIQSGEWGPLRQVCAGLDIACHDLAARRTGLPLHAYLGGQASGSVAAYASGIGPEAPAAVAARERARGHESFKLKVGFGVEIDTRSLDAIRGAISERRLMIDANQGWTLEQAIEQGNRFAQYRIDWLEEPLRADRPVEEWRALSEAMPIAIAAGENMNEVAEFQAAIGSGIVRFLQPDAAKWGGISGCLAVARAARAAGLVYCPHYLGGGIGLLASAHLLAAAGGEGMLEIDTNPNPLRERLVADLMPLSEGRVTLSQRPGLGIADDLESVGARAM
jgi:L-alanine-DL-glutamate epimerase-like enolase superfamily enzyme